MPLVSAKPLLLAAQQGGYAVGAFNIENMEMAQAVIAAAEEQRAPVLLQTTPGTVRYAGCDVYAGLVGPLAAAASVPVALHLDHGESFAMAAQALRAGYTSIMIDGSHSPFEENIAVSRSVAEMAAPCGVPVEAELGMVGGKEDDLDGGAGGYTDPAEAVEFVKQTGVDSLAVGIGTAHGVYAGTPVLDKELLSKIRAVVDIPLVLHGASGLSDEDVRDCISRGICKVNFATELRIAFSDGVKAYLAKDPAAIDPKKYGAAGRESVKQLVMQRIQVCGSAGKA